MKPLSVFAGTAVLLYLADVAMLPNHNAHAFTTYLTRSERADAGPSYTLQTMDGTPDQKFVDFRALSDSGVAVGRCRAERTEGSPTCWQTTGAGAALDPNSGIAYDINSAGVIVGRVGANAVAWHDGKEKTLKMPSGTDYSEAFGINGRGEVSGVFLRSEISHAFLRSTDAQIHALPNLPGLRNCRAVAINDHGDIVGGSYNDDGIGQACVWRGGKVVPLAGLGGAHSDAFQVNAAGDIVGEADVTGGGTHACLWRAGKPIDLGALPNDTTSRALGINNHDEIIGTSGFKEAFVWKDGTMYDLKSLIDPKPAWTSAHATAINDKGQIAGWGADDNGRIYGFLLTPSRRG